MSVVKKVTLLAGVLLGSFILTACETTQGQKKSAAPSELGDDYGVLIAYSERERAGTEAYRSLWYVNKNYMYVSDDRAPNDFLLFDRKKRTIYSVTRANKTVFVIKPKDIKRKAPIEINYVSESQPSSAIPQVSGRVATHYRYNANGKQCYDAVTLEKEFLPEVVEVLREFRQVLAGEHASTVHSMPADTHDPCDLALNIYHADQHLETGLPLREWDQKGFLKFMVNYKLNYKMDTSKFEIPADYNEFSVGK